MTDIDLSPLFTPYRLKNVTVRNRFALPGMQRGGTPGGMPSPALADFYRRVAEGGTALVIGGSSAVDHPSATWHDDAAMLTEATLDAWRRCAEGVRRADSVFLNQLWHEGAIRQEGRGGPHPDAPTLSPSGLARHDKPSGRAATLEELAEIKDAYVRAAIIAMEVGAHGVEIHAAHGYLLDQFLWPETNLRDDGYGGPLMADRVRWPAEVMAAVREAIGPEAILSVRLSQWKELDYNARIVETPDELQVLVRAFEDAGADIFHISTRRFYTPEWPGSDWGMAGWVKSMTTLPVITVGCVGLSTDLIDGEQDAETDVIASNVDHVVKRFKNNEFDFVAVGRSNIGDQSWVEKVRTGRYADISDFTKDEMWLGLDWEPGLIEEAHSDTA